MIHDPTKTQPEAWRETLAALIAERMRSPFRWGVNDCCMFVADAVKAKSGKDHAKNLRGSYADEQGAAAVVAQLGGLEAIGALAGVPVAPLMAGFGDVGLVAHEGRDLLAACAGELWLAPAARGLAAIPLSAAKKAWSVPNG